MITKLVRDGKVAVLVTAGYGCGWSTGSYNNSDEKLFDNVIIDAILNEKTKEEIQQLADERYPDEYSDVRWLTVEWIPIGTFFKIIEHDGFEQVEVQYMPDVRVA